MLTADQNLITPCHFRADGIFCIAGLLYHSHEEASVATGRYYKPVLMEGGPVTCPACEGKGVILTERGCEMMMFLQTYAYPKIREMVQDIMEETQQ